MLAAILFFKLVVAHAVADYWAQSGDMARGKNRHIAPANVPPGQKPKALWWHWLTAHALIHGGAVMVVTGSVVLGIAEFVCHWCIDFAKIENWTGPNQDQGLHIACKALWVVCLA